MTTRIEVNKNKNENANSMLRRFSRKVRQASILNVVRGRRYFQRDASQLRKKQGAMARIEGQKKYEKLFKMGRLTDRRK